MFIERRSSVRYPLILTAHYQTLRKRSKDRGIGRTVDISSRGILIVSAHNINVGAQLSVAVEWPALLDGSIELLLVATGEVVRAQQSNFAVEMARYEFRTTKRKFKAAAAGAG
jgi:c-di-GMP-binding flagellar brake protein YcgR